MEIFLVDINSDIVDAWEDTAETLNLGSQSKFKFNIEEGSIFDIKADALVSPANSFGFMDGGIDLYISRFFGNNIQKKVQEYIQNKLNGECVVGNAFIVPTNHERIPFLISAPTMRTPMHLYTDSVNVYLATRAAMITALSNGLSSVVFSGMGTGVGGFSPVGCAQQMFQAILDVENPKFPKSLQEAVLATKNKLLNYKKGSR